MVRFGTSPVGTKVRAESSPVKARQDMLETFIELLGLEPSIVQYQQIDTILDGFMWSIETYEIVKSAAEAVFVAIHERTAPWIGYQRINEKRST